MSRPLEYCKICEEPTGRAGRDEDSIYLTDSNGNEVGPLCEGCSEKMEGNV